MPICPICDDSGLQNSDSTQPEFCYCAAGKQARRQWEANRGKGKLSKPASFIDIANLEQVNASVDAMRSSLLGSSAAEPTSSAKHPALQLLYHVAHAGHEVSMTEATQLYDLAKALEGFLGDLAPIGRTNRR
ncbi:MAG: hypothetical protein NVS4B11_08650 [Ktedonobacteraceae bacterium]